MRKSVGQQIKGAKPSAHLSDFLLFDLPVPDLSPDFPTKSFLPHPTLSLWATVLHKKRPTLSKGTYHRTEPMDFSPVIADVLQTTAAWNEQACLQGCVRNDIASQGQFYKHFYPRMMAMVLRYTQDKDEACSILNNGFLKAFKKIQSFRNQGSLEGWLRKIVIHAVSDYFRYKHPPKEVLHEVVPDKAATMPQPLAHDYQLLLKLLNNLPPATRTVVNLYMIDGYTHKEIAGMMRISENTSKWHVAEGRKILHQQLSFVKK